MSQQERARVFAHAMVERASISRYHLHDGSFDTGALYRDVGLGGLDAGPCGHVLDGPIDAFWIPSEFDRDRRHSNGQSAVLWRGGLRTGSVARDGHDGFHRLTLGGRPLSYLP